MNYLLLKLSVIAKQFVEDTLFLTKTWVNNFFMK